MADDIWICVAWWIDEAVVEVFWIGPSNHDWRRILVLEARAVALVPLSSSYDALNIAVGRDRGGE